MKLLCLLNIHKWKPLQYKAMESLMHVNSKYSRSTDQRVTREYCLKCGKIRNLIEFEGSIIWKQEEDKQQPLTEGNMRNGVRNSSVEKIPIYPPPSLK